MWAAVCLATSIGSFCSTGEFRLRLLELAGIGGGDQGRVVAGAAMRACVCL